MLFFCVCTLLSTNETYGCKNLVQRNHQKNNPEIEVPKEINEQEYIQKVEDNEYWWNLSINTAQKVPHNKPDLVIWNTKEKNVQYR